MVAVRLIVTAGLGLSTVLTLAAIKLMLIIALVQPLQRVVILNHVLNRLMGVGEAGLAGALAALIAAGLMELKLRLELAIALRRLMAATNASELMVLILLRQTEQKLGHKVAPDA